MQRIYKHFGFTGENIESQKQVCEDICIILDEWGIRHNRPLDIAIRTKNGMHKIPNVYITSAERYSFDVVIPTKYSIKTLKKVLREAENKVKDRT